MFKKKNKITNIDDVNNDSALVNNTEIDEFSDFFDEEENKQNYNNEQSHINEQAIEESSIAEYSRTLNDNISKNNQNNDENKKIILYVVIDKQIPGILNYFRESGLKVSSVFYNITDIKNAVLMQPEQARIVLIDTGMGRFTTTTMRAELIDMLGISDENNKTTVFYTDSVIKVDTTREIGKLAKSIDWVPYKSLMVCVATLLNYRENYIYDMEDDTEILMTEEEVLSYKGFRDKSYESQRMQISGFSSDSIMLNLVNSDDERLQEFKVKI